MTAGTDAAQWMKSTDQYAPGHPSWGILLRRRGLSAAGWDEGTAGMDQLFTRSLKVVVPRLSTSLAKAVTPCSTWGHLSILQQGETTRVLER
jgi:hypothetical protein